MKFKVQNSKFKIAIQKLKLLKAFKFLLVILTFNFYLFTFTHPAYAKVDIGKEFGFGEITSLGDGITKLVTPGFSLAAVAVVIYFLIGAFKFLASGGDKEQIAAGRGMITHAIIGFMILMFAFLILQFLLSSLFEITGFSIF